MTINCMQLVKMTEAELSKMTKAELVAAIKKDSFYPEHYKNQFEKLTEEAKNNASNERAACVMLAAFVGVQIPKNEYTGQVDSNNLNILELAGLVAAKCAQMAQR